MNNILFLNTSDIRYNYEKSSLPQPHTCANILVKHDGLKSVRKYCMGREDKT